MIGPELETAAARMAKGRLNLDELDDLCGGSRERGTLSRPREAGHGARRTTENIKL
jgi:hypothetical protein